MSFGHPDLLWLALAGPLVLLVASLLWRRRLRATSAWASRGLWPRLTPELKRRRLGLAVVLLALAVVGTSLSLAQPRWGLIEQEVEQRGVDLVIVLDSSLSMSAVDLHPNRLSAAKTLIREFLARIPQHRVGLVQAEGDGLVLAPLTLDHAVIGLLLDSVEAATLPTPGTQLASGLERAFALFPESQETRPVVLVVSDGEDHDANWDQLLDAIDRRRIHVHAIGVGTAAGSPIPLPGTRGKRYKTDRQGQTVVTRLQGDLLQKLSAAGQGTYVEASNAGANLTSILDSIAEIEARTLTSETITQQRERFQWFLAPAALCLLLSLTLSPFSRSQGGRS